MIYSPRLNCVCIPSSNGRGRQSPRRGAREPGRNNDKRLRLSRIYIIVPVSKSFASRDNGFPLRFAHCETQFATMLISSSPFITAFITRATIKKKKKRRRHRSHDLNAIFFDTFLSPLQFLSLEIVVISPTDNISPPLNLKRYDDSWPVKQLTELKKRILVESKTSEIARNSRNLDPS